MPCVLIRSSSSAISRLKASACRWRRAGGGDLLEPGDVYRVVRGCRRVYFGMSVYYPCRPFWRTSSGRIGALCVWRPPSMPPAYRNPRHQWDVHGQQRERAVHRFGGRGAAGRRPIGSARRCGLSGFGPRFAHGILSTDELLARLPG